MAPSTHNTQPWRFRISGSTLDVFADRSRQLNIIDVARRQQIQSCGAALYNARVAVRAMGYEDETTTMLVDSAQPDHVATLHLGKYREVSRDDLELMKAIGTRHTNRRGFQHRPVPPADVDALVAAAEAQAVTCVRLDPEQKRVLAALVAESERQNAADPAFRAEAREWSTRWGSFRHDGVPAVENEYGDIEAHVREAPVILVFGTSRDEPADWLATGEALEAVLLRATAQGLVGSFLEQVLEIPELRTRTNELCPGIGIPQMILRIGVPTEPILRAAPRRDLDDVLQIEGD